MQTMSMRCDEPDAPDGFRHDALFYEGMDEFLAGTVPFIRAGIEAGEPVLVAVDPVKIDLLQAGLSGLLGGSRVASRVRFAPMPQIGKNPARIIPVWREFVDDRSPADRPLRGIGEPIWAGRTGPELVECQRHESLLNVAFAGAPAFRLLCPYDVEALDGPVIDEARRSHPAIVRGADRRPSTDYAGLDGIPSAFAAPLEPPPPDAESFPFGWGALAFVRDVVAERSRRAGLEPDRAESLVLAVNEIATNSIQHGGGFGTLTVWAEPDALVCEVRDAGSISEPLVGRVAPSAGALGGRGLWIANQVCELVQVRSFPDGVTVRLRMSLSGPIVRAS